MKTGVGRMGRWLVATVLLAGCGAISPAILVLMMAGALAFAVWRHPETATEALVVGILAVRPSLDAFSEHRLGHTVVTINPSVIFGLGVLAAGLVLAVHRACEGTPLWPDRRLRTSHLWLFAAYGISAVSGVRLYGSEGLTVATREVVRVLSIVAGLLVVCWWAEQDAFRYRRGWWYLLVGLAIPMTVATAQLLTGRGYLETEGLNRLQGTFSHPNAFGPYLVPFILAAVADLRPGAWPGRPIRVVFGAFLTVVLALTYSRTAILALVTGLIALSLLQANPLGVRRQRRGVLLVVVLGIVGWLLVGRMVRDRFANVSFGSEALEAARTGASENSLTWRLINWGVLIQLGVEHPVAGHGAGMTTVLNPIVNGQNGVPFNAHDDFVRFFFEGGVLGLVCYVIYAGLLCQWAVRRAWASPVERVGPAAAVAASWLAMLFLTVGTPELSLQTAVLTTLYGMLALNLAPSQPLPPRLLPEGVRMSASDPLPP